VTIRDFFLENFAGDLEYHPRRALVYLTLGIASASFWIFSSHDDKFAAVPLVFALGSLTLAAKGVFLLRKSSEGLGLSYQDLSNLSGSKPMPSITSQAAQVVQDFGTGALLLWPLLHIGRDLDPAWNNPPRLLILVSAAVLFSLGWVVRRLTSPPAH
jgi:hypothetical protein